MPKRGRPSSRSATQQSCVAQRASWRPFLQTDAVPRAGRPHVEPTYVYPCPPRGGDYSARGAREGESKEGGDFRTAILPLLKEGDTRDAEPNPKHAVWRRVPRLVLVAEGFVHRNAQHLAPLPVDPPASEQEGLERVGAEVSDQRPKLGSGPVLAGPTTRPPR